MDPIDRLLEKMYEECPVLKDTRFLKRYPGIRDAASFLYSYLNSGRKIKAFEEMGIETLPEYLSLLEKGEDLKAYSTYRSMLRIFGFKD